MEIKINNKNKIFLSLFLSKNIIKQNKSRGESRWK